MKKRVTQSVLLVWLLATSSLFSCSNDIELGGEPQTIKLFVSGLPHLAMNENPTGNRFVDSMRIKETENSEWELVPMDKITDFDFEYGYDKELLVEKSISTNESITKYKLIEVLNRQKSVEETKTIQIDVSPETGLHRSADLTEDMPSIEGMKVRVSGESDWWVIPFGQIRGFEYIKGYSYKLLIERTEFYDGPIFYLSTNCKLLEVVSMERAE